MDEAVGSILIVLIIFGLFFGGIVLYTRGLESGANVACQQQGYSGGVYNALTDWKVQCFTTVTTTVEPNASK